MVSLQELQSFMKNRAEEDRKQTSVNVSASTLDEALKQASIELGLPVKKIEYEILEKGSKGVLGTGKRPFLVLAYPATSTKAGESDEDLESLDFGLPGHGARDNENADGRVFVRLSPEGVLLKVTAPTGSGARVTERQVVDRISSRIDSAFDRAQVARVVKHADGEFVRIADYRYNPANDAILSIEVADMEMKAYLTALPPGPGGADPGAATLRAFLEQNGIVEGVDDVVLAAFEDSPQYKTRVLVAEGAQPKNGADARVAYNFRTDPTKVRLKETNGRVDFKELNLVQNVVEGQVLARKVPAERGEAGRTVTGKLLPAKDGKDISIEIGKNVILSEDGMTATAETNGQVIITAGKLNVEPIYTVPGDVNLKTGNILFLGTVIVKGNVEDGFSVKAAGNIEVLGSVGKCDLDAEGDIIVHQGITGKSSGIVRCGKSIWSKFIENARAEAAEMVVVSDGIINSIVAANRRIICKGKRASIVGGQLRAAEEINAKTLGSVAGMETICEVGYDPKSKERFSEITKKREQIVHDLDEVELNMKTLQVQLKAKKELPKEKIDAYNELNARKVALLGDRKKIEEEVAELESYLAELKVQGKISASGTVYPGVRIVIKDASLDVRSEFRAVTFLAEGGTVKVTKYEETDEDVSVNRRA